MEANRVDADLRASLVAWCLQRLLLRAALVVAWCLQWLLLQMWLRRLLLRGGLGAAPGRMPNRALTTGQILERGSMTC